MREQDGEEAGQGAREAEEPAYHARRPMNAFLIFCKRHRAVVRDKYPNLENRSITKILGEWWANLEDTEKSCYTGLAKQYKDAFFSANPDFKWYKLPAPPLRTLARISVEPSCELALPPVPHFPDSPELRTNNNSTRFDYNKRLPMCDEQPLYCQGFTPGKLADEANMGGVSSLIASDQPDKAYLHVQYSEQKYTNLLGYQDERPKSKEDSIQELQNALSETTRMFEDYDEAHKVDNETVIYGDKNLTNREIIDRVVDHGIKQEARPEWLDERTSKSGRSCKGKRYQEFMAVGGLLASKRSRLSDWDYGGDGAYSPEDCSENGTPRKFDRAESPDERPESAEPEDTKPFRPADFDLDAKIAALPSLSLEKFQQRKRENKKKKRFGFSLKPPAPPFVKKPESGGHREAERWRDVVIGSQKRKPRKMSITRLEVNSMVNRTGEAEATPVMKIATEAPAHVHRAVQASQHAHVAQPPQNLDLFALATLAEVAANTSKMEETVPPDVPYQYRV